MTKEATPLQQELPAHNRPFVLRLVLLGLLAAAATLLWRTRGRPSSSGTRQQLMLREDDLPPALLCGSTRQDAGYIRLPHKRDSQLFYWYFESQRAPSRDPLVLWLTGGPGCSGLLALLTENGPCSILPDLSTQENAYAWNQQANVVWMDQPTGVGFSYGAEEDADRSESDVQQSLYWFIQGFLLKHPELKGRDLFLAGESYAGHYIPAAAHFIIQQNRNKSHPEVNLQGIAMGNALVSPVVQFAHALDIVLQNDYNVTLLSDAQLATAQQALPACVQAALACQRDRMTCADSLRDCQTAVMAPMRSASRNMYDLRMECDLEDSTQCYSTRHVTEFLNSMAVRSYLNVTAPQRWQQCTRSVSEHFASDILRSYDGYVAELLDTTSVRVLVYAGDADLVCNWLGCQAWTLELDWRHKQAYKAAPEHAFLVDTPEDDGMRKAGSVRSFDRLAFLRVFESGHMVPNDQPAAALAMLNRFLQNEPL